MVLLYYENVWKYLIRQLDNPFPWIDKLKMLYQTAKDIFSNDQYSYLNDFELCKPANKINSDKIFVVPYMAPEVLSGQPFSSKSNIYSFGIIMWEVVVRRPHLLKNHVRPEIAKGTPYIYKNLMERCWTKIHLNDQV
ncbi:hypothetical protein Glove_390g12 [Diversispora epigaea]|uniref:Protein kinase domain-containing protein n=1 Tax=Diversispora epigaea TaxID=1348612 RepID=A0A397H2L2_9GLOM|nr:hypothetical protein Glove_390g12 [Diversispora epigaea]